MNGLRTSATLTALTLVMLGDGIAFAVSGIPYRWIPATICIVLAITSWTCAAATLSVYLRSKSPIHPGETDDAHSDHDS